MRQRRGQGRPGAPRGGRPRGARPTARATAPPRPPRGSRARRSYAAACGAALVLLATGLAWAAPRASSERDVQLVYCLDGAHRAGLVSAAVRLKLLAPGSTATPDAVLPADGADKDAGAGGTGGAGKAADAGSNARGGAGAAAGAGKNAGAAAGQGGGAMTLQQWAERRQEEFGRACSALMAAASESPGAAARDDGGGGWFTDFLKQVPLLAAGALLTLGGQASERLSAERRQFQQQLAGEESAYRTAVHDYLTAYETDERADHGAVRTARTALARTLNRVPGPRARRDAGRAAADALPLGRPLRGDRDGYLLDTEGRGRYAEEQRSTVEDRLRLIPDLNRSKVYWSWRSVRDRIARRERAGTAA
ncbi:hypothetical protein AB0E88_10220 [Streptomyces sp. NPDC028635]|uniref:hypothetical protein n=1 Tax=Streptomyces sp. NPDC028635 TaxID=3154800 RepID=UPI0034039AC7